MSGEKKNNFDIIPDSIDEPILKIALEEGILPEGSGLGDVTEEVRDAAYEVIDKKPCSEEEKIEINEIVQRAKKFLAEMNLRAAQDKEYLIEEANIHYLLERLREDPDSLQDSDISLIDDILEADETTEDEYGNLQTEWSFLLPKDKKRIEDGILVTKVMLQDLKITDEEIKLLKEFFDDYIERKKPDWRRNFAKNIDEISNKGSGTITITEEDVIEGKKTEIYLVENEIFVDDGKFLVAKNREDGTEIYRVNLDEIEVPIIEVKS